MSRAADSVLAERRRQIEEEGWTLEHDDQHVSGELAVAAAHYALAESKNDEVPISWPPGWDKKWWKPSDDLRRNCVKAAALLLAEIERIDRSQE